MYCKEYSVLITAQNLIHYNQAGKLLIKEETSISP